VRTLEFIVQLPFLIFHRRHTELLAEKLKEKSERIHFQQLKEEQLMKDLKEKEAMLTKRDASYRRFTMQLQALEPDRYHSQAETEESDDRQFNDFTTQ
jgi:hypothetical protein